MKKILVGGFLLIATIMTAAAQCEKKITWTASKAIFLNADGKEERTEESKIVIETSKNAVMIKHGDSEDDVLTGNVKDFICDWKEAYKNGKTVFKSELADHRGDVKNGTITIEGKDGKINFILEVAEMPGRKIQVPIEDHKEE